MVRYHTEKYLDVFRISYAHILSILFSMTLCIDIFYFFLIYMYCMRANKPKVGKHYLYMTLMLTMNIFTTSVQHRQQFSYNSYNILHINCVYVNFVLIHTVSDLHTISVYMFFIKRSLLAHRVWARLTHVYVTKVSRAIMIKSFKWWRQLRCCEITFWACFMF